MYVHTHVDKDELIRNNVHFYRADIYVCMYVCVRSPIKIGDLSCTSAYLRTSVQHGILQVSTSGTTLGLGVKNYHYYCFTDIKYNNYTYNISATRPAGSLIMITYKLLHVHMCV